MLELKRPEIRTVAGSVLVAEGGHVVRERVGQQQADLHGRAPLHCETETRNRISPNLHPGSQKLQTKLLQVLQEQVRRFQQQSSFLLVVPRRYLEQLRRPKHKSLMEEKTNHSSSSSLWGSKKTGIQEKRSKTFSFKQRIRRPEPPSAGMTQQRSNIFH